MSKKQRPPCPDCGTKNPISRGKEWHCKKCGRYWSKTYRQKKSVERPDNPCPECGSIKIISKGLAWRCKNCGLSWMKTYKRKPKPLYVSDDSIPSGEIDVEKILNS